MKKIFTLFTFLFITIGISILIGGEIGLKVREWTQWMSQSFWGKTYGISWGILFGLMGLGGWIVWEASPPEERVLPMLAFGSSLLAMIVWSYTEDQQVFLLALVAGLLLFTMGTFWFHSKWGAFLLFPLFAWILFATVMNAWILMVRDL